MVSKDIYEMIHCKHRKECLLQHDDTCDLLRELVIKLNLVPTNINPDHLTELDMMNILKEKELYVRL